MPSGLAEKQPPKKGAIACRDACSAPIFHSSHDIRNLMAWWEGDFFILIIVWEAKLSLFFFFFFLVVLSVIVREVIINGNCIYSIPFSKDSDRWSAAITLGLLFTSLSLKLQMFSLLTCHNPNRQISHCMRLFYFVFLWGRGQWSMSVSVKCVFSDMVGKVFLSWQRCSRQLTCQQPV